MVQAGDLPLLVVAAALMRDGRVLVQQRPVDKAMGGLWEFPGGKVEPGEAPEHALVRELAEELAIEVDCAILSPLQFGTGWLGNRALVLLLYRIDRWSGVPRAVEAPALRWVDAEELSELPVPPADRPLVSSLRPLLR
jgi:8-oxo-dGTP diphosphatase